MAHLRAALRAEQAQHIRLKQQISAALCISEATARSYVSKLHLASRGQATLYALRTGLADQKPAPDAPI